MISNERLQAWISHLTHTIKLEGLTGLNGNRELLAIAEELKERREIDNKILDCMKRDCIYFKNRKNHSTICYPPDGVSCPSYGLCLIIEKLNEVNK